jgi:pimeloyl-ACP methyl ester carboxylesterase
MRRFRSRIDAFPAARVAFVVALVLAIACVFAEEAPTTAPRYTKPLGIAMDEWNYPFPVRFRQFTIEGDPVRMAYMDVSPRVAGQAPGAVVLLHGKNFYGSYWENTIRALSDAGFRVIVPDQIGFGKSSKPDVHYSFDLLAANTIGLLDELKVDRFTAVGHSMGGMLAVRIARNYPDRVVQLVLENPIGLENYRQAGVPARSFEQVYENELAQTPEKIRDYFKTYFPAWKPEYEHLVEPAARMTLSGEFPRWAKASALTYQMILQQPVRQDFHLIKQPTLLVIGQADRTAVGKASAQPEARKMMGNYPELGRAAQKDVPDAKLVELEGVGHIPHIQAADKFHAALLDFLRSK